MSRRRQKGEPCPNCGFGRCQCLELALLQHIRAVGLPEPVREYPFATPRKFRADFAYPGQRLLIEVEGTTVAGGRHQQREGYANDLRKYNLAARLGWTLLRFDGEMVRNGEAVAAIEEALTEEPQ